MNRRWTLALVGVAAGALLVAVLLDRAHSPDDFILVECAAPDDVALGNVEHHPVIEESDGRRWGGGSSPLEASTHGSHRFEVRYPWSNPGEWSADADHALNVKSSALGGVRIELETDRTEYVARFEDPAFLVLKRCDACREQPEQRVRVIVSDGVFGANTVLADATLGDRSVALGPLQPGRYDVTVSAVESTFMDELERAMRSAPDVGVIVTADTKAPLFDDVLEFGSGEHEVCACGS